MTATDPATASQLLDDHMTRLLDRWRSALDRFDLDGIWVSAGEAPLYFHDDQGPAFRPSVYFSQWVDPAFARPGAMLRVQRDQVTLFTAQPEDYWHAVPPVPEYLTPWLALDVAPTDGECADRCRAAARGTEALIGPEEAPGANEQIAPPAARGLLDYLHFHRAVKSPYELEMMRAASVVGARGHIAAGEAFHGGGSEFEIHMAYLAASRQTDNDLPYGNIVALNEHASLLHYQLQDRERPAVSRSLLIDAGGQHRGYASDITRTYAAEGGEHDEFRALLALMAAHQDKLLDAITPGQSYAELHDAMHRNLGEVLAAAGLVTCSAEAAFAEGITRAFCPHGLGHLLGLHVHDAGGHLADEDGVPAPPPEAYPSLRFTRSVEVDQVFTIEPGLYFIDMLLAGLERDGKAVAWDRVDALRPYGGIRIEDNVRVLADGVENLTRDAWRAVAETA